MWKVTVKGILSKKVRFLLTGIAVMLGVAFVSGTFVLTETISNTFNGLFNEIYQNTDAVVRAKEEFNAQGFSDEGRGTVSADLLSTVRNAEGVEAAEGQVQGPRSSSTSRATPSGATARARPPSASAS